MSVSKILNRSGQNTGKITGAMLAVDVGPNMTKSITVNGSILLDSIPSAAADLNGVLAVGNDAGGQDILNVKDLTVNQLNYTTLNPAIVTEDLNTTLVAGNDAGGQDLVNVGQITCTQLNYTTLNPAIITEDLNTTLAAGNNGGGQSIVNLENIDLNGALTFSDAPSNSVNIGLLKDTTTTVNTNSINIGNHTSTAQSGQGVNCISIGLDAAKVSQGGNSVAIGPYAGLQGLGNFSVALGASASQNSFANNQISINATGAGLNSTQANAFIIAPVRQIQNITSTCNLVYYDSNTKEVTSNFDQFVLNGTSLLATSAGGGAGQWLNIKVNGVNYKIELRNT